MSRPEITATMSKFGYPETELRNYEWWSVLLRPKQITLGSLVLAAKCDVQSFSALPAEAFTELARVTAGIELTLKDFTRFEKLNYLMLMMVDPHPHFHVIPRYKGARSFDGVSFPDESWPGPPQMSASIALSDEQIAILAARLQSCWAAC